MRVSIFVPVPADGVVALAANAVEEVLSAAKGGAPTGKIGGILPLYPLSRRFPLRRMVKTAQKPNGNRDNVRKKRHGSAAETGESGAKMEQKLSKTGKKHPEREPKSRKPLTGLPAS